MLERQIRDSYYQAYRADPSPAPTYGAPAGEPESAVIGPSISHSGVVYGETPASDDYWAVVSICIGSQVGCQDAGAVQAFHRRGPTGLFSLTEPCSIATTLFRRWYPNGLPVGIRCPGRRTG